MGSDTRFRRQSAQRADDRRPEARQLHGWLDGYCGDDAHGLSGNRRSMRFRSIRAAGWRAARRQTARRGGASAKRLPCSNSFSVLTISCRSIQSRARFRRQVEPDPMALQNRVTPFGDIVAIPQRGMFTGNRGIIHSRPGDPDAAETALGDQGLAHLPLRIQRTAPRDNGSPQLDRVVLPGRGGSARGRPPPVFLLSS